MDGDIDKTLEQSILRAEDDLLTEEGVPPVDYNILMPQQQVSVPPDEQENFDLINTLNTDDKEFSYWAQVPVQAVGGIRDAANAIKDLPIDIGESIAKFMTADPAGKKSISVAAESLKQKTDLPEVEESEKASLQIGRKLVQFMAPYAGVSKMTQAAGLVQSGSKLAPLINGAITDLAVWQGEDQRLADVLKDMGYDNPLAADEDDTELTKRVKTVLEGAGLGIAVDSVVKGVKASIGIVKGKQAAQEAVIRTTEKSASIAAIKKSIDKAETINIEFTKDFRPEKETIDIITQRKLAEVVGTTPEQIRSGEAFKGLNLPEVRDQINSFVLAEEKALFDLKQSVPDTITRMRSGDPAAKQDFVNQLVDILEINGKVLDKTADIGRIQNFRKNADVLNVNTVRDVIAGAKSGDVEKLATIINDAKNPEELRALVKNMADGVKKSANDPSALKQLFSKETLDKWYMNSILSGPATLIGDTLSNVVFTGYNKIVEKPVAAGIGGLRTMIGGNIAKGDKVYLEESAVFFKSILDDSLEAARFIKRGFDEKGITGAGENIMQGVKQVRFDNVDRFGGHKQSSYLTPEAIETIPPHLRGVAKFLNNALAYPTKFMQTKDDIAKALIYRSGLKERATRRALDEGLKPGSKEFAERVSALIVSPIDNIVDNMDSLSGAAARQFDEALKASGIDASTRLQIQRSSIGEARKLTFTDPASDLAQGVIKVADAIPGGRFVIPFVTTIDNLTRRAIDRSPASLVTRDFWDTVKRGGAEADEAIARTVTGTTLMIAAYNLALNGYITGEGPAEAKDRDQLLNATGWRPRSFYVNGKYIDFSRSLGPLALTFQIPANIAELARHSDNEMDGELEKTVSDQIMIGSIATGRTLLSQSWASGLANLFDAVNAQDENAIERTLSMMGASLVAPNMAAFISNQFNPYLQSVEGLNETIRIKYGAMIRPKHDIFGDVIKRDKYLSVFAPFKSSDTESIPSWKREIFNSGAWPTKPSRTISVRIGDRQITDGVKLDKEQYERLLEIIGEKQIKENLKAFVESPAWNMMTDAKTTDSSELLQKSRRQFVQQLYNETLRSAEDQLVQEYPELQERGINKALAERTRPDLSPLNQVIGERVSAQP